MPRFDVCQHIQKGQLYDAIIMEVGETLDSQYKYKVHYKRWNKRLDEFVPASRIVKLETRSSLDQEHGPALSEQSSGIANELTVVRNKTVGKLSFFKYLPILITLTHLE